MKIAYFIMLHNNLSQIRWLIEAIYNDEDHFIIHIDRKSENVFFRQVKAYVGSRHNVEYLSPRRVNRFGWSMVEPELRAMRVLVDSKYKWKYLINLSGQDYPIKPISAIKAALTTAWPSNFVEVLPFQKMREINPYDPHLDRRFSFEIFGTLINTRIRLPFPEAVNVKYKGSAYHMLTHDFCEWLLSNPITWRIERRVKYTWTPDELFYQALVMNSVYENSLAEHFGREIIWPGRTGSPKTLGMEDYERLSASSALFARKFDESVDREVLVSLARDHGYKVPATLT